MPHDAREESGVVESHGARGAFYLKAMNAAGEAQYRDANGAIPRNRRRTPTSRAGPVIGL